MSFHVPYYLKNKRKETGLKALHEFRAMAEKQTGKVLRTIQIDGGGELNNGLVDAYCTEHGITIEKVPHDSSAANGVAERLFRTVMDRTRTLLEEANLLYSFWGEASATLIYVNNFIPSSRFPDIVLVEAWTQKRHDILHLRPFGCDCWATLPRRRTDGKLGRQAVRGKLLEYMGRRGYRVWIPETRKIEESHDVTFKEGRAHCTRKPTEVEEIREDVGGEENTGTTDLEPKKSDKVHTIITTEDTSSNQQWQISLEPIQSTEPNRMEVINTTMATWQSTRGHILSRRYLESAEYSKREQTTCSGGEEWSTDTLGTKNTLAMITQSPYSFAASSGDLWVPQSYKQGMRYADLWRWCSKP